MKKYIWIYIIAPLVGVPITVGGFFVATTPSPEVVCNKTLEITTQQKMSDASIVECAKALSKEREFKGVLQYRKEARCIADAETKEDLNLCAKEAAEYEKNKKK